MWDSVYRPMRETAMKGTPLGRRELSYSIKDDTYYQQCCETLLKQHILQERFVKSDQKLSIIVIIIQNKLAVFFPSRKELLSVT